MPDQDKSGGGRWSASESVAHTAAAGVWRDPLRASPPPVGSGWQDLPSRSSSAAPGSSLFAEGSPGRMVSLAAAMSSPQQWASSRSPCAAGSSPRPRTPPGAVFSPAPVEALGHRSPPPLSAHVHVASGGDLQSRRELGRRVRQAEAQLACARSHIGELERELHAIGELGREVSDGRAASPCSGGYGTDLAALRERDTMELLLRERTNELELLRQEVDRDRRMRDAGVLAGREGLEKAKRDLNATREELADALAELAVRTGELSEVRSQLAVLRSDSRDRERGAAESEDAVSRLRDELSAARQRCAEAGDERDRAERLLESSKEEVRRLEDARALLERQAQEREEQLAVSAEHSKELAEEQREAARLRAALESAKERQQSRVKELLGTNTRRSLLRVHFDKLRRYWDSRNLDQRLREEQAVRANAEARAEAAEGRAAETLLLLQQADERAAAAEDSADRSAALVQRLEQQLADADVDRRTALREAEDLSQSLVNAERHHNTAHLLRRTGAVECGEAGERGRLQSAEMHCRVQLLVSAQECRRQGSVGMVCAVVGDAMQVTGLTPGGPASTAGLRVGDIVRWVDTGRSRRAVATGKELKDALHPLAGVFAGSRVQLGFHRPPSSAERAATVVPEASEGGMTATLRKLLNRLREHGEPRYRFRHLDVDKLVKLQCSPSELCMEMLRVFINADTRAHLELPIAEFERAVEDLQEGVLRTPGLISRDALRSEFKRLDLDGSETLDFVEFFPAFRSLFLRELHEQEHRAESLYAASPAPSPRPSRV
eukprot:TRINITY_DN15509_c0_g1_i1.p1 TRINITY_DN15509_c0_g1~~TRINITY_DN15509_c0_g1_i1.p1  ORF type:complete len:781 (+),score=283.95 TRINITY_DN15509_c0_g1_i1:73-2415(+)